MVFKTPFNPLNVGLDSATSLGKSRASQQFQASFNPLNVGLDSATWRQNRRYGPIADVITLRFRETLGCRVSAMCFIWRPRINDLGHRLAYMIPGGGNDDADNHPR